MTRSCRGTWEEACGERDPSRERQTDVFLLVATVRNVGSPALGGNKLLILGYFSFNSSR